jgi:two-component system cell cycle sensor histidine kinase/response regulator CckA
VIPYDREELAITLFEESGDALFLFDPASEAMIDVNPMAERLSGYPYAELLRMPVTYLFRSASGGLKRLRQAFQRTGLFHSQEDFLLRHHRDGVWLPVNLTVTRLHARPKTLGLISARDLRERKQFEAEHKQLEEQLRQSQKMEAVGRLAGGVAHDFNNLLTVILGYGSLLLEQTKADDEMRESLQVLRATAERAAALTRQLLAFSRKQLLSAVVFDLNTVIAEMEPMLRRLIGEDVQLQTDLAVPLAPIKADPHQLEQVLLNLVVNARDAMPSGGRLTIQTRNQDAEWVGPASYRSAVVLTVRDTGCGMDEHVRSRLFEPFFTTKEAGKGTGLGLATVYGIVQQSGGRIHVESAPGAGAAFHIELPCVEGIARPAVPQGEPSPPLRGNETILLVEDEDMLRNLSRIVLRKQGYNVLEAPHGADALAICQSHQGAIDLLVTDVVMPVLNGRELADQLARLRPETKVLYVSGYTEDAVVRKGVLAGNVWLLHKPFTPSTLASKVREVLDSTRSPLSAAPLVFAAPVPVA